MIDVNWDEIEERTGDYNNPVPGGYIGKILDVSDDEEKQYLELYWDFAEGALQDSSRQTFDRAGWWPGYSRMFRSYKPKALGFFKAFKTAVEVSNRGYQFSTRDVSALRGKLLGVVLAEEEYRASSGDIRTRLYVAQVRSVDAIRKGDFKVPGLKKYKETGSAPAAQRTQPQPYAAQPRQQVVNGYVPQWQALPDDGDLPF